ncbi:MAG: DUF6152 family protein [Bryobacteraceae bacterium]
MKSAYFRVPLVVLALSIPVAAFAHHGWAAFNSDDNVTFQATVTEFHFFNPHTVIEFTVKNEKGQAEKWQGELTSLTRLATKGWTPTTLEPGDKITISGHKARSGVHVMRVMKVMTADGKDLKIELGN